MKFYKKQILWVATALLMQTGLLAYALPDSPSIRLNQNEVLNVKPIIQNGAALVPLRAVGSLVGAEVGWEGGSKTITLSREDTVNILQVNSKKAYKEADGERTELALAAAPKIIGGGTYVPLRYVAESLDLDVFWDQSSKTVNINEYFSYLGERLFFGSSKDKVRASLGDPQHSLTDELYEYWFYTRDYENVMVLYFEHNLLAGFSTNALTAKYRTYAYDGKSEKSVAGLTLIRDEHKGNKIAGMGYNLYRKPIGTSASLFANEKIIFELTNGFRVHYQIEPLVYNEQLSEVARAHTEDMAKNNYFDHVNLQGLGPSDRITKAGINWISCGENIAAGNSTALKTFEQWVNSLGHRENMLQQVGELGVGGSYREGSEYRYYYGQNFALISK